MSYEQRPAEVNYTGSDNLEVMLEAEKYNKFLVDQVLLRRHGRGPVLDFGAGLGTFSEMVREHGVDVHCLEIDQNLCEILEKKEFHLEDSVDNIETETYDYVYSLNVFEHIEDDLAAARQLYRIMKPGGRAFIFVPAFKVLFGDMDRKVRHFRRYDRKSIKHLFESACFQVKDCKYADSAGFFVTLLYNLISNGSGDINKRSVQIYDFFIFPLSRLADRILSPLFGKNVFIYIEK